MTWLLRTVTLPHFRRHKGRTALTVVGIAIGVAAVVATSAVTESIFATYRRTVDVVAGAADLAIVHGESGVPETLVSPVLQVPGVRAASGLIQGFLPLREHPEEAVAIFGIDLLADQSVRESQFPRKNLAIDDILLFVAQPDSIAVARPLAKRLGLTEGSRITLGAAAGPQTLTVRGFLEPAGPAALFGGNVALVDLPTAQRLFRKHGKVDEIDVDVEGGSVEEVAHALEPIIAGRANVERPRTRGERIEKLLESLRVTLALVGLIAQVVAFFIIYHTVAVSITQRRREIAILEAVGVTAPKLLTLLLAETLLLGLVGLLLGFGSGMLLAGVSLRTFAEAVSGIYLRVVPETLTITPGGTAMAVALGLAAVLAATLVPAGRVLRRPRAESLQRWAPVSNEMRATWHFAVSGLGLLAAVAGALAFAPRSYPYGPLVGFIMSTNTAVLVGVALLSPLCVKISRRVVRRLAASVPGVAVRLAAGNFGRDPFATAGVVATLIMGFAWVLTNAALVASVQRSILSWVRQSLPGDLYVSAGSGISLVSGSVLPQEVGDELRAIPGVRHVVAHRILRIRYRGMPIIVQAVPVGDLPPEWSLAMVEGDLAQARAGLAAGDVLISDNLSYKFDLHRGDAIKLATPSGRREFRIAGTFIDYSGIDLGSVSISRQRFKALWRDDLVNTFLLSLAPGADVEAVRREIQRRIGRNYRLFVAASAAFRRQVTGLIDQAFGVTYAVLFVAAVVAVLAVVNFLMAETLHRQREIGLLAAVGLTSHQIQASVLTEVALIGLLGGGLAVAAGTVTSHVVVRHSLRMVTGWTLDYVFPLAMAGAVPAAAVVASVLASYGPARWAARLDAVTALAAE